MESLLNYLIIAILTGIVYFFITTMLKVIKLHDALMEVESLPDEQEITNLPDDWIFPLVLEYKLIS